MNSILRQLVFLTALLGPSALNLAHAQPPSTGYLSEIRLNANLAQQLFERAEADWVAAYDEELISWLEKLARGKADELTPEVIEKIRTARVFAQRVRSLYYFLDKSHEPPQEFADFVKVFGKLKDALFAGKKIGKKANQVLAELETLDPVVDLTFTPTTDENFKRVINARIKMINALVSNRTLDYDDHHLLRKYLRDLMTLTRVLRKVAPAPGINDVFKNMKAIDTLLGEEHDELAVEKIGAGRKEKRKIEHTELTTSAEVRSLVTELNDFWLGKVVRGSSNHPTTPIEAETASGAKISTGKTCAASLSQSSSH
jgi:hypothetical protein